jgi:hypothetical protein
VLGIFFVHLSRVGVKPPCKPGRNEYLTKSIFAGIPDPARELFLAFEIRIVAEIDYEMNIFI